MYNAVNFSLNSGAPDNITVAGVSCECARLSQ